ncbi:hypothetical protein [Bradyrhizobium sp.]|uniref:hypothetical protein n=1 Tax=Bradyrhizobium sp. TaxID=376 RepID=UPI00239D7C1E|nr:hypothetical protein [Bradyrhizobium sp.]MDE2379877.1 hypothetical protein [Bradyrhizobium sp.]
MANEAFALSPISARAAEPTEADYDAIREAFMETARGRWFLGEYAKRNRNADTTMVLDAVARIEETLAAQRQPVVEDRLPGALAAIRQAIAKAEIAAGAAFDRAAIEASLGAIHRGVRIVKEISWRWREIGADGRICDLIDSQLVSIESACGQISGLDPHAELKAAFDLLKDMVEQTDTGAARPAAPAPEAPQAAHETTAAPNVEAAMEIGAGSAAAAELPEQAAIAPERADVIAESAAEIAAADMVEELSTDAAAEAEDEAVLDLVALEMAAADPDFDEATAELAEVVPPAGPPVTAEPIPAKPVAAVAAPEAATAAIERALPEAVAQAARLPMPSPLPEEASLGATILASGMLQQPPPAANDPLAPIRRMTQAEKIAFFS